MSLSKVSDVMINNKIQVRNYLINSNFDFWQRGTSTTVANAATTYQADRWYCKNSLGTNGVITYSQVAGVSDGAKYGAKLLITTAPTAAQTNGCELYQIVENAKSLELYNQTASFNIKVKSFGNVNQVGIQIGYVTSEAKGFTGIGSEVLTTVNTSTFTSCSVSGQALGTSMTSSGVIVVRIRITAVSSGNTYALNNGFVVEQGMLNIGLISASWCRAEPTMASEEMACKSFYNNKLFLASGLSSGTANYTGFLPLPVPMRVAPTLSLSGVITIDNGAATFTQSSASIISNTTNTRNTVFPNFGAFTGLTPSSVYVWHASESYYLIADAEI